MALRDLFSDIADAIREKDGTTNDITASTFPDRIRAIKSGAVFSISILTPPNKTTYFVGDTFDSDGLKVIGTFEDGLSFNIPNNYLSISPNGELSETDTNVTISYGGQSVQQPITVAEKPKTQIFGVMWNYADPSTALTRLKTTNDPYSYVTTTITSEPSPAVGTTGGSSPFDSYMPWAGMEEYNIINRVGPKQDESGFSRTANDVMVYIPEFWYKCVDDSANSKRFWYISNTETNGFEKHPGSGKYVSRYTANSSYKSISGNQSVVSITRATARTNATAKGTGWQLYDFASLCAVQLLYLVEYADWNSQEKVGRGYVDENNAQINTGATDSMTYHTGIAVGTNGKTAMQYRHIENMWGNLYQFVDGINFSDRKAYVCLNPEHYADDTSTNYTDTGITLPSSNGYIKWLGYSANNDWCLIPNTIGGSENTYIPDYVYSNAGWRTFCVGGYWSHASLAGAWCFGGSSASASANSSFGVRLLYTP